MTLHVLVTIDIDNDGVSTFDERDKLSWHSLENVPAIAKEIEASGWRATWFVRADGQLRDIYGRCDYLFAEYAQIWEALAARGDEIAWHPHIYSRASDGRYTPEVREELFVSQLESVWRSLEPVYGQLLSSVRLGEGFCSNSIMACLARLGMQVDSTAMPGRRRADAARRFDWESTPNRPYRPSCADYRRPGTPAVPNLVEVPMSTALVRAEYDPKPLLRYLNPAYHAEIFAAAVDGYLDEVSSESELRVLNLIVHPDETLAHAQPHGLYAFSLDVLRRNLDAVRGAAERRGFGVIAQTACDIPVRLAAHNR